jgi:radical SAM superfamily enzyme YgiQ (UPF0313 family)
LIRNCFSYKNYRFIGETPMPHEQTPKVLLVNPALTTTGFSFITPRWLYVLAQATPADSAGDPILVDEVIEGFDPARVNAGDVVGVGISTGNCRAGYRVVRAAKARGARVIVGGVHATIFPEEPLEMGADAVVTGNGDQIWPQVVADALAGRLQKRYDGGRVPGEAMCKARWDLLDPTKYLLPSIQTVAGCPENCSFCSVWVTDGRQPRQRLGGKIIEEVNELYRMGFRFLVFADDNFSPATQPRIARESSPGRRRELERIRQERLEFFDEYARAVPPDMLAFTQMTTEAIGDEEYFSAMVEKMRIRVALVGIESFSAEGLAAVGKSWNPAGREMIAAIRTMQARGILVLSSIICGLESDSPDDIRTMREFAVESGSTLAQFTVYRPYPGTRDYFEMRQDRERRGSGHSPKHQTQIVTDRFWLEPQDPIDWFRHATMSSAELRRENQACWDRFYSLREIVNRAQFGVARTWPWSGRLAYVLLSLIFHRVYAGHGVAADNVQRTRSRATKLLIQAAVGVYNRFFRRTQVRFTVS